MGDSVLRLPLLELGRRLVCQGALADQHDVFLLYLVEIRVWVDMLAVLSDLSGGKIDRHQDG
jgi:hypothetical protein